MVIAKIIDDATMMRRKSSEFLHQAVKLSNPD